jgi:proline racemase
MCVATVLVETGLVPITEPETNIVLDAPGGLVRAQVSCSSGRAQRVTVVNVPSFVDRLDAHIEVTGIGTVRGDVAYGGDSFVLVDGQELGFGFTPDEARDLALVGAQITAATNEQIRFDADSRTGLHAVSFCQIMAPLKNIEGIMSGLSAVVIRPAKIDRSPCGTGCSARMAVLHARGMLRPGDRYIGRSILGSRFDCQIVAETEFKGVTAIIPSISGRAWITGVHQHTLDPEDPWPNGYRLSDTWPAGCSAV